MKKRKMTAFAKKNIKKNYKIFVSSQEKDQMRIKQKIKFKENNKVLKKLVKYELKINHEVFLKKENYVKRNLKENHNVFVVDVTSQCQ